MRQNQHKKKRKRLTSVGSKNKDAKRLEEILIERFGYISLNKDSKENKLAARRAFFVGLGGGGVN